MELNNNFWSGRPTFVTGGTGLLGSDLIKKLISSGADVVCLFRDWIPNSELIKSKSANKINIVSGDITDRYILERTISEYEIDTIIHLAAQTIVTTANIDPIPTFETNIKGTWNLLDVCRNNKNVKQIIIASSDKAYGNQNVFPYREDTSLQGRYPYDVSKSCADLISQSYAKTYQTPLAITRCGNFYGGGDLHWNRIVPGTIRSIIKNQNPIIRSDGNYIRDYFYVEDGSLAYMHLAESLAKNRDLIGESFNFSTSQRISVLEMVNLILEKMNSNLTPIIKGEANNEIRVQTLDSNKARNLLGWKPRFTLDESLEKTINWYERYFEEL